MDREAHRTAARPDAPMALLEQGEAVAVGAAERPRGVPRARRTWRERVRTRGFRRVMMWSLPLLLVLIGGYSYLVGGRYIATDDAYVKAGIVTVSSDVAGRVVAVAVKENQRVAKGDVLFRLDDRPYRYALERAQANLAQARLQVEGLHANYRQKQAELAAARETLAYQRRQVERNRALLETRAVSPSAFDTMRNQLQLAEQTVVSTEQQIASIRASLGGTPEAPVEDHPLVKQAQAQVDQAKLDLDRTVVLAPVEGIVSKSDSLHPGQYLNVGAAAFALVATRVWIEANFKETEITHMRAGHRASVTIDTYPGHSFAARIESIGAATGAEFSILPPQNATGNWVKITQRVPVRLVLVEGDRGLVLRAGMSVGVEVDTQHRRPALALILRAIAGPSEAH